MLNAVINSEGWKRPPEVKKQSPEGFCIRGALKKFANFTEKYLCWSLFIIKLQAFSLQVFQKETPTQVLSCEVCETFKNTYFEKHLQTTVSGGVLGCS